MIKGGGWLAYGRHPEARARSRSNQRGITVAHGHAETGVYLP